MHLSLYGTTYRFGRLAYDIQGRRVDREDRRRREGVAEGSALVAFRGAARMLHQTEGGGVLCRWRRRRKGKLVLGVEAHNLLQINMREYRRHPQ